MILNQTITVYPFLIDKKEGKCLGAVNCYELIILTQLLVTNLANIYLFFCDKSE